MLKTFPIISGDVVLRKRDFTYQRVLDDFSKATFIGILMFNISSKANSELLRALKTACANGTNAVLVTNVPNLLAKLDEMMSYFGRLTEMLNQLLRVNLKIDNTHI